MTEPATWRRKALTCFVLGAAVLFVFWPGLQGAFVNYDDPAYVVENWHVQHGLNWACVRWALTADTACNWHPLTWLSHTLDCQLYGLHPAGHHLTSLLLHTASAVLLLLLLNRMTGAFWRSVLVAAIFALHPLRVESVSWVSERKDVLSVFFFLLTVGAYVRYTEEFKVQSLKFKVFYGLSLLLYAFGLMSKPTLVTLPFVLLLLDCWPLRRWKFGADFSWRPVAEKIPFFALSAACCLVTFLVQNSTGAVATLARFPLGVRLANIPVAYTRYLSKNFWPTHLAAYYPYVDWPAWQCLGAVALLAVVTAWALWRARSQPFLAVGWFWFLGMLVPNIGLVQSGGQSLADRFCYLPGIGLWIMVVWALHDLAVRGPILRAAISVAAGLVVLLFALVARHQTGVYKDSETLWEATLRSDPHCLAAHNHLSRWLMDQGQWDRSLDHARKALAILPGDPSARCNLALIYLHQGLADAAIAEALQSIQSQPHSEVNRQVLARAYLLKGDFARAADSLREAIKIEPSAAESWCNLGYALLQQGQVAQATDVYQRALELNPDYALAHNDLGNILLRQGRLEEAMEHFQRAVEITPTFAEAHYNLAGILARSGHLDEAIAHCQKAVELQPNLVPAQRRLADLLAAKGRSHGH